LHRLLLEFVCQCVFVRVYECDSQRIDLNTPLWHVLDVKSMFEARHRVIPNYVIY
jgi:hypothetical protein